jgi:hypothetical protein
MSKFLKKALTLAVVTAARGVGFGVGDLLVLAANQARDRLHNLTPVDPADDSKHRAYKVQNEVFFKAGERIGLLGAVAPAVAQLLSDDAGTPLSTIVAAARDAAAKQKAAGGKKTPATDDAAGK